MGKVRAYVLALAFVAAAFGALPAAAANQPPVLEPIGDKMIDLQKAAKISFVLDTHDPDGDAISTSAWNLPPGSHYEPSNRTFWWFPTNAQVGEWTGVRFEVTDGQAVAAEEIAIRVSNSPNPKIVLLGPGLVAKTSPGEPVSVRFTIRNDGTAAEAVRFEAYGPVAWSLLVPGDVFVPAGGQKAVHLVVTPTDDPLVATIDFHAKTASGAFDDAEGIVRLPYVLLVSTAMLQSHATPVTGVVLSTWLNGQPAGGVTLRLDERVSLLGFYGVGPVRTTELTTGADGRAPFSLPVNPLGANAPGPHQLIAQVTGLYNSDAADSEIYLVV